MGPIEAIALGQSARGITDLVLLLGILALNFFAVAKIITKGTATPGTPPSLELRHVIPGTMPS